MFKDLWKFFHPNLKIKNFYRTHTYLPPSSSSQSKVINILIFITQLP